MSYTLFVNQIVGSADHTGVLHSLFQFVTFDEGLRR
jgi:hypothetical protein